MKKIFFIALVSGGCMKAVAFYIADSDPAIWGNNFCLFAHGSSLHSDTVSPVKIQLEKTRFNDMAILFIPDTAKQTQDIGPIFSKAYSELMKFTGENQLKFKKFLARYYSSQPPWIMDIAFETDKLPSELNGRIKSRAERGGEVVIAHMWGPYSELRQAYLQIENWLKQNNRTARGNPFEVYLNDPFTVKDPSEIQTDIYQPLQ
jgi:effector-binding domain-containing protein